MAKKLHDYTKEELLELVQSLKKAKKFGLVWEDKPEQVAIDCQTKLPVLQEVADRAITKADDQPTNLLIEGDNYHSLSTLNYTHAGKIDVIYIDPPYNTGNKDFIYNDHYVDKEDAFKHSKWLSFMSKRLKLAKDLLSQTGVIFISIDDNELTNLKLLCDAIFGTSNYIATLPVVMNLKGNQDEFGFAGTHEYILVYASNKAMCNIGHFPIDDEAIFKEWLEDDYGLYKEADNLRATGVNAPRNKRPNLYYPIYITNKGHIYSTDDDLPKSKNDEVVLPINPDGDELSWYWKKETLSKNIHNLIIKRTKNGTQFYRKQRPSLGDIPTKKPKSLWYKPEYSSSSATTHLKNMFGEKVFNNPKPVPLIKDLIYLATAKDSFVLDFFAGSGTTGQAVIELNDEDGGSRKFIICTNNENSIAENITYQRVSKVIEGYADTNGIPANVRYFKTDFVNKADNTDQTRFALVARATDMIKIRENTFETVTEKPLYKVYASADAYSVIIFEPTVIDQAKVELAKLPLDKPIYAYVFSLANDSFDSDFADMDHTMHLCPIPESILEVYKRIFTEGGKK
jgi:adenine-specific DNA-methyltransferase